MYKTAEELETSPYVIRYIAQKHNFKRSAEKAPAILKGVRSGNLQQDHYKTLDFSKLNINSIKKEDKMTRKEKATLTELEAMFLDYIRSYTGSSTPTVKK